MNRPAFSPGDVIVASRLLHGRGSDFPRRFVVHAVSAGGYLYVHPEGEPRARWNEFIVDEHDASRPAPGELEMEYGR